jgi:hypothetical protein
MIYRYKLIRSLPLIPKGEYLFQFLGGEVQFNDDGRWVAVRKEVANYLWLLHFESGLLKRMA